MPIRIHRDSGYADRVRAYKVVLDGAVIGEIRNGQQADFDVPAGRHQLRLKIDWCGSNTVAFDSDGSSLVEFVCGSNLRGFRLLAAIAFITIWNDEYLWVKRK